jgi:uncharacterized UPF0160 family protein
MAMQKGHSESITAYFDGLNQLEKIDGFKDTIKDILKQILEAKRSDDTPAVYMAMYKGHFKSIKAYFEGLNQLAQIPEFQETIKDILKQILEAKRSNGTSALSVAMQEGHSASIKAYFEGLKELAQIDGFQEAIKNILTQILEAKRSDGTPALFMAMQNGHATSITAYFEGLNQLAQINAFKEIRKDILKEILLAQSSNRIPALSIAMYSGHSASITAYFEGLNQLVQIDGFKEKIKNILKQILEARDYRDIPALFIVMHRGYSETVKAYFEGIRLLITIPELQEIIKEILGQISTGIYNSVIKNHCNDLIILINDSMDIAEEGIRQKPQVFVTIPLAF